MDDYRIPTNHAAAYVDKSHYMLNRGFHTGYKMHTGAGAAGAAASFLCLPSNLTWTGINDMGPFLGPTADGATGEEFVDLSTASFYTIQVAPNNANRLRVVKPQADPGVIT